MAVTKKEQKIQSKKAAGGGRNVSFEEEAEVGTPDEAYNLISVLYHALQGAETYLDYIEDAEDVGDKELVQFFQEVREEEIRRADRAKELLASRLHGGRRAATEEVEESEGEDASV